MLHVTCDVIGIAQYHFFEIQDGGHVFCTLSKFKAFFIQFIFENVRNRTKNGFSNTNRVKYKNFS